MLSNNDKKTIAQIKNNHMPVYVYGNMNTARRVCHTLVDNGITPIAFVVDAFAFKEGIMLDNFPVKCIDDINDLNGSNVVIGFDNVEKTKALLSLSRYLLFKVWHLTSPGNMISWTSEFVNKNAKRLSDFRTSLADQKSKLIFDALKKTYLGGGINELLSLSDSNQYFNELTFNSSSENDVYVDCGAFDGDSVKKYIGFTGGSYKKIIALEPMAENCRNLTLNTKGIEKIDIICKGTWSSNTRLAFSQDTSASRVSSSGDVEIEVSTLDSIIGNEDVTFIKMDIEGSEYDTLIGSKNIIERCHPILAICVYHKIDDMIKLSELIKSFKGIESYRFYLRHHSNRLSETVLYVIPY